MRNFQNSRIVSSKKEIDQALENSGEHIVIDFETKGVRWWEKDFHVIGIAIGGELAPPFTSIYVPFYEYDLATKQLIPTEFVDDLDIILKFLTDSGKKLIYHNALFDHSIIQSRGFEPLLFADTMLWWHLVDNYKKRRYGLKVAQIELLGWAETNDVDLNKQIKERGGKKGQDIYIADKEVIGKYALLDAESTYDLYKILNRKMDELELHSFWKTIVRPYIDILKRQYERGMTINSEELEGHSDRLQTKMDECQNRFLHSNADLIAEMEAKWHFEKVASYKSDRGRNKYLDDPSRKIKFNIQSKPQLGDLLFGLIGLRILEKTKSGRYKVDEDILKQLAKKNESIKDLLEYNKLAKRKQTCLRFCKNINDKGLLHPSFNITGTVSGRLSERGDTPLLTLDKKFLELMKAMYSRKGYSYLYQDYKAAEPVVTAHFSEDETYKKIARGEGDIYLELVEPIFGKSKASLYDLEDIEGSKEKLKVERKVCKVVQLAASYGATKYSIARNVFGDTGAFSLAQAQKILSSYKRKFAKVYKLEAKLKILYKDAGCLKNGLGRAVLMDKTKDALNRFIQSTAHDCLIMHNIIISRMVEERGLAMYPLHIDTHDSMIWEVKDSQTKEGLKVYSDSLKELNDYLGFSVDFRADAKVGKNFKEILSED